jgi:GTP:adenosylcobinamide-phosphate guanylyltransferase
MRVDAIVLAGARNDGKLQHSSPALYEALIAINGSVMADYVLAALRGCPAVDRVLLVGPEALRPQITTPGVEFAACSGASMIDSIRVGMENLASKRKVLLVTSDIPLINTEAVSDFLERCRSSQADIYYPVVCKEVSEQRFPGARRTYVRLREGVFTGGNLVLLQPEIVDSCHHLIEQAIAMRKQPLQLARLLGGRFFLKLLVNRLSVHEIEARVERILGFRGVAVITPYPEIGIDVDKPSDLELVERFFREHQQR